MLPQCSSAEHVSDEDQAEEVFQKDENRNHEYLPITGLSSFTSAAQKLILGADSAAIKENRVGHLLSPVSSALLTIRTAGLYGSDHIRHRSSPPRRSLLGQNLASATAQCLSAHANVGKPQWSLHQRRAHDIMVPVLLPGDENARL